MKKINYRSILFMIAITVIFTGTLATINELTKNQIDLNEALKQQKSLLYVLDFPIEDKNAIEVSNLFSTQIKAVERNGLHYYEGYENDSLVGYIFPIEGDAVWGSLQGYVALSPDLHQILGLDFLSHSETPGLGGRIDEPAFKEQFRQIDINPDQKDTDFIIYRPTPGGQVDAITGATGTSNAVRRILNSNLQEIINQMKGGSLYD
ncbi:FMN-binding protein [Alkaliphilus crotonatoxidans]